MKGIILAGGSGTRLYPVTQAISKQLMPIYDKPMIYYPLSTLMIAEIRDILIITTPQDSENFKRLLGNGRNWGMHIQYAIQENPDGLAQAFIIGADFIGSDDVCLILGDNLFHGTGLSHLLQQSKKIVAEERISVIFAYEVSDPQRYGVVEFDTERNAISIEEKPDFPKSNYAVVGLYFYTNDVIQKVKHIKPSLRGELEITTLNEMYLNQGSLKVELMNRGYAWLDTGTHESMLEASNFIHIIEKRQGVKISCPEEIAWLNGWINDDELLKLAQVLKKSQYGLYLLKGLGKNV